jgi:drug/metabolite transporter (DMT)-like permease
MKLLKSNSRYRSSLYVLAAAFGWASLGPLMLCLPKEYGAAAVAGVRGLAIALFFCPALLERTNSGKLSGKALLGGLAYALSALTYLASLRLIPVAVATPLHYTSPLFLLLGALLFLRSAPSATERVGALLSCTGAITLAALGGSGAGFGIILALASALFWACYLALQARLSAPERHLAAFYGGVILLLTGIGPLLQAPVSLANVLLLFAIGSIASVLPLLLLAKSASSVSPLITSLLLTTEPVIAALLAQLLHQQALTGWHFLGMSLLVLGCAWGCGLARLSLRSKVPARVAKA